MNTDNTAQQALTADVINIVVGMVFLTVGAIACATAAIRWQRGVRILLWWGIFSGVYAVQKLGQTPTVLKILPHSLMPFVPYVNAAVMYLLLVSALFAWRELTVSKLTRLVDLGIFAGLAIAFAGIGTFVLGGPANKWMFYNNLLAAIVML